MSYTYIISSNNIQIKDSYKIDKMDFDNLLNLLKNSCPIHPVLLNRSKYSLKMEMAVHNLCYKLRIAQSRTKDVDLNYPLPIIEKLTYNILWPIAWLFIS